MTSQDRKTATKCQPVAAGHPPVKAAPRRRAARQSRHARRHRLQADVALSARIPVRPARHRTAAIAWYPILYGLVLTTRPQKSGANYAQDLEPRARTNRRCGRLRAARPRSLRRRLPTCRMSASNGACATATRRPRARSQRLTDQGCDRILTFPLYPQYSATTTATANDQLFRALMKMRRAPAVRTVPPYYDEPVYIDALARSLERQPRHAGFRAGGGARLLPRHPESLFRQGRPLSLPLPGDDAAAAREARLGRQEADHHLPVALRRAGMAAALYRQDRRKAGEGRREVDRHHQSRLLRRLHRDAGRDRPRGARRIPACRRHRISRISPA